MEQYAHPFNPIIWPARPHDFTGDNNLGYSTNDSTQRYVCGTQGIDAEGGIYRYIHAGTAFTYYGIGVWDEGTGAAVSYESLAVGSAAGAQQITMTQGSITKNQYEGGKIIVYHASGGGRSYTIQGNDATSGTLTTFYITEPLPKAVTSSDSVELFANPYNSVAAGNSGGSQWFIGIPMALLTDTYYGWVKTRGTACITPQSTVGNAYVGEGGWWRHDGSIDVHGNIGSPVTTQYAGFCVTGDASGDGPLFMLMGF